MISYTRKTKQCSFCNGTGNRWIGSGAKTKCYMCNGKGVIVVSKE